MKKNAYIAAALLSAGLVACNNEPAFKVEGEVAQATDKMLYFEQTGLEGIVTIDSVKLNDKGAFSFFQVHVPNHPTFTVYASESR